MKQFFIPDSEPVLNFYMCGLYVLLETTCFLQDTLINVKSKSKIYQLTKNSFSMGDTTIVWEKVSKNRKYV